MKVERLLGEVKCFRGSEAVKEKSQVNPAPFDKPDPKGYGTPVMASG
jgi:hypothetical protein